MDESNDKTDKSCIILATPVWEIAVLGVCICQLSTLAQQLTFLLPSSHHLRAKASKAVAIMSDTTNVMTGARSGVQKRIKNEHPHLYDISCICHLADLTVKAGLKALPVDIDLMCSIIFTIAVNKNFIICVILFSQPNL